MAAQAVSSHLSHHRGTRVLVAEQSMRFTSIDDVRGWHGCYHEDKLVTDVPPQHSVRNL